MGRLLIIGANGMLGHALAEVFQQDNPVLVDKNEVDITDPHSVSQMFQSEMPEVVLNVAAFTDVDGCETQQELAFAVNAEGVRNIAIAAKEVGALIVHYSTDYVFPGTKQDGYNESDFPEPLSVYGQSKAAGEKLLQESGVPFLLIRTQWLYGPFGKNFVTTMLAVAKERNELRIVNDQHGSPTYTKDLAEHTKKLMESDARGIHHATNSGTTTWFDFATEIFRNISGAPALLPQTTEELHRPARRPLWSALRNTKDAPMRSWQDALGEYMKDLSPDR